MEENNLEAVPVETVEEGAVVVGENIVVFLFVPDEGWKVGIDKAGVIEELFVGLVNEHPISEKVCIFRQDEFGSIRDDLAAIECSHYIRH